MTADFAFNWNSILNVLKTFGISDFFDIIIVAFLVYKVLSFASNSRAGQLIKGICLLFVLYFIASEFTLKSFQSTMSARLLFLNAKQSLAK